LFYIEERTRRDLSIGAVYVTLERLESKTMNKQQLLARRDYFNLVHAVTMRAIRAFTEDELDFRPQPGMRTPRELIFHMYSQEKLLAEAAQQGRFTLEMANGSNPEDQSNAAELKSLGTVSDALAYATACHRAAEDIFRSMSEPDIARNLESPIGTYPAWQYFLFAYDEHWHHRGQLYTYLRLLGKEPPMLYDYQPAGV
jgi:uncharacterized damage-inducible protein DinB